MSLRKVFVQRFRVFLAGWVHSILGNVFVRRRCLLSESLVSVHSSVQLILLFGVSSRVESFDYLILSSRNKFWLLSLDSVLVNCVTGKMTNPQYYCYQCANQTQVDPTVSRVQNPFELREESENINATTIVS